MNSLPDALILDFLSIVRLLPENAVNFHFNSISSAIGHNLKVKGNASTDSPRPGPTGLRLPVHSLIYYCLLADDHSMHS